MQVSLELGGRSAAIVLDDARRGLGHGWPEVRGPGELRPRCVAGPGSWPAAATTTTWSTRPPGPCPPSRSTTPWTRRPRSGRQSPSASQERVEKYIALGQEEGARVVIGGNGMPEGLDRGWYVRTTIFADVDNRMRIAQEEVLGPVVTVIPFDDVDDAVQIANDSEYGLADTAGTADFDASLDVARRVRTGAELT